MTKELSERDRNRENDRRRRAWAKQAPTYDKQIGWFERRIFGDQRSWACSRARGATLEVAVGTGLNLRFYDPSLRVTGVDLSPEMLAIARKRAAELDREIELREGDAHELPFEDASFDTVLATYSLCNIPDIERAVGEMKRVLRPGGQLILVDHIRSGNRLVYLLQKLIEMISIRVDGDHMTRRPSEQVHALGLEIVERDRLALGGIVERLVARVPG